MQKGHILRSMALGLEPELPVQASLLSPGSKMNPVSPVEPVGQFWRCEIDAIA